MPPTTPASTAEGSSPAPAAPTSAPTPVIIETQPVAPIAAAPVTPEAPKPSFKELTAKATPEQLRQLATGKAPKATTPAPAEPVAAPVVAPAPEAVTAPAADPDEQGHLPTKFRFKNEEDRTLALYAKQNNVSLAEAARRLTPPAAPVTPPTDTTQQPAASTPVPPEATRITAIDADIATKRAEIKKLREDMEHDKADDLMVDIAALTGEKQLIAAEVKRSEQQQAQSFEGSIMASRERAFTQFPELGDPTSAEHVGLIGYVTMEQAKPERQAFFNRPDYPELIAKEFKQKFGKSASAATPAVHAPATPPAAATPAQTPAPVVTKPQAKQVGSTGADGRLLTTAAGVTPAPEVTREEALARLNKMNPKERLALLRTVHRGTQPTR